MCGRWDSRFFKRYRVYALALKYRNVILKVTAVIHAHNLKIGIASKVDLLDVLNLITWISAIRMKSIFQLHRTIH